MDERTTAKTARRYETLARGASLVAAFGVDLALEPIPGVHGAHIDARTLLRRILPAGAPAAALARG